MTKNGEIRQPVINVGIYRQGVNINPKKDYEFKKPDREAIVAT